MALFNILHTLSLSNLFLCAVQFKSVNAIEAFIYQGCIKCFKSDSKDIRFQINAVLLKKKNPEKMFGFRKYMKQHNVFNIDS